MSQLSESENKVHLMTDKDEVEVKSLDDDVKDEILVLLSQDDEKFTVPRKVGIMSQLVKTMADGGISDNYM